MACNFVVVRLVTGATNACGSGERGVRRLIIVTRESVTGDSGAPLPIGRMEALASFVSNESAYWQQAATKDRRGAVAFSFGFCPKFKLRHLVENTGQPRRGRTAARAKKRVSESCVSLVMGMLQGQGAPI